MLLKEVPVLREMTLLIKSCDLRNVFLECDWKNSIENVFVAVVEAKHLGQDVNRHLFLFRQVCELLQLQVPDELDCIAEEIVSDVTNYFRVLRCQMLQVLAEKHREKILDNEVLFETAWVYLFNSGGLVNLIDRNLRGPKREVCPHRDSIVMS